MILFGVMRCGLVFVDVGCVLIGVRCSLRVVGVCFVGWLHHDASFRCVVVVCASCLSLRFRGWLCVVGCVMLVVRCVLSVVRCLLLFVCGCFLWFAVTCYLLIVVCCLLLRTVV